RRHRRDGLAISPAVVFLIHQISVPDDDQAAVLAGARGVLEGVVELHEVHAADLRDLGRVPQSPPSTGAVRRREVFVGGNERGRRKQDGCENTTQSWSPVFLKLSRAKVYLASRISTGVGSVELANRSRRVPAE